MTQVNPIIIKKAVPLPVRANAASKSEYPLKDLELLDAIEARAGSGEKAFRTEISRTGAAVRALGGDYARRTFLVGHQQASEEALAADPKAKGPLTVWRVADSDPKAMKPRAPKAPKAPAVTSTEPVTTTEVAAGDASTESAGSSDMFPAE